MMIQYRCRPTVLPVFVLVLAAQSLELNAQDSCSALVNQGVFDHYQSLNSSVSTSVIFNAVCTAYNSVNSTSNSGSGTAILDFGGASASISNQALSTIGSYMCSNSSQNNTSSQLSTSAYDVVDPALITAYNQCEALHASGLTTSTTYDTTGAAYVLVTLRYSPPVGSSNTSINAKGFGIYNPDPLHGLQCSGPLYDGLAAGGIAIGNNDVGMMCSRYVENDPTKAFYNVGNLVIAAPATITIYTDAGNIAVPMAALPAPQPNAGSKISAIYTTASSQTVASGTSPTIDFSVKVKDTLNLVTPGPAWIFKAPTAGTYHISTSVQSNMNLPGLVQPGTGYLALVLWVRRGNADPAIELEHVSLNDDDTLILTTDESLSGGDSLFVGLTNTEPSLTFTYTGRIAIHYVGP